MDVYRIQTSMVLGGTLAPELAKMLKTMGSLESKAKGVEKAVSRWASPIDRAASSADRFSRAMTGAHRGASGVEKELVRINRTMMGLKGGNSGLDKEMARWAAAIGKPVAEMRVVRRETQGVASAARGVTSSISGWTSKLTAAASAMKRMQSAAQNMHLPTPSGGGNNRRGAGGGSNSLQRRRHGRQFGEHEGSHLAGAMGVYGGINTMEYLVDQGAGGVREDLRAKNAGLTPEEIASLRAKAGEMSRMYPSLSPLGVREQGRLLIPNVGNYEAAMQVLPEYLKGQVAMQTMAGPGEGGKDMEAFARYIDVIGRSMSVDDTKKLIDGYVRSRQLDSEAVSSKDYVNAAKAAASPGKALNVDFWSKIAPALMSQQGGARTGTDLASAYQNTVVGRGTDASIMAQAAAGLRDGFESVVGKNGKTKIVKKGSLTDETLYNANPYEWAKKHIVPTMVGKGMLPEGYAKGDYSQDLSDKQRADGGKFLAERFSSRRGANIFSMMIQDMDQIEQFVKRWEKTRGTADVLSDQKNDPYVAGSAIRTQAGAASSALAGPAIPALIDNANRIAAALGGLADTLEKHPAAAQTAFGVGAAGVGGAAAAGITALTLAAGATLSIPALAIGAGAAVTIATLTIPFDQLWSSLGFKPGIANGQKTDYGVTSNPSDLLPGVPSEGKGPYDLARDKARAAGTQGLGLSPVNVAAAIDQAAAALGRTGTVAPQAASVLDEAAGGLSKVSSAAGGVPGALSAAANAISSFVARLNASATAGPPGAATAGGGGGVVPGKQSSVIHRGGAAPTVVHTQVALDGRVLGKAITRHQVAEANTRNGTGLFDDNTLRTPVGYSPALMA